ncbi:MAG: hypothetical protein PUC36_06930 [Clostridiales bacterium]|nr:hypothetical protein [Clostridiales bacterium]
MVIFDQDNEQIIFRDGKYYLRTDVGHFAQKFIEIEISKVDADKVMQDITYVEQLIWDYQNKLWGLV